LAIVRELFENYRKFKRSEIMVIEGEAGIGKTRLLEQLMDDAEKENFRVIHVEGDLAQVFI